MTRGRAAMPDESRPRWRGAVLEQLWDLVPHHCLILTDPVTRLAIDKGLDRAHGHGFRAQRDLNAFVTLMVGLGAEFDEDPQLPWAHSCLQMQKLARRSDAMAALLTETAARMDVLLGPEGVLYRDALAWARDHEFEVVADYGVDDSRMHELAEQMYAEKYAQIGASVVQNVVVRARTSASKLGLDPNAGAAVVLQLMVLLGSGVARDPFHPWVTDSMASTRGLDPNERARRLHAEGVAVMARYRRLTLVQRLVNGGD